MWSAGRGEKFAGAGVDGLDGDFVAEAFEAADVVAGLAAGVHALFVVAGAEVVIVHVRVGGQGVDDGEHGVAGRPGLSFSASAWPGAGTGRRGGMGCGWRR